MKIVRSGSVDKEAAVGDLYFGGKIDFECLTSAPHSADLDIYMCNFEPGARNHLHFHKVDQVLIATSGEGIVADDSGEHVLRPGDLAIIPAGHKHWHGATAHSKFSHLAISKQGDEITIAGSGSR